jgi:DNA-directed RNA polymerase specialized sigma24 family protein
MAAPFSRVARSATSVLAGKLLLHEVRDTEALCARVIARSRLTLDGHDYEDLLTFLVESAWELSLRYERGRGSTTTFAGYATTILRRRVFDWQRGRYGRGYRPQLISLDDLEPDRLAATQPGSGVDGDASRFAADMRALDARARRPGRGVDWLGGEAA